MNRINLGNTGGSKLVDVDATLMTTGAVASVFSVGALFELVKAPTVALLAAVDGITVVQSALNPAWVWVRMPQTNAVERFSANPPTFVDSVAGNDDNDGLTAPTALKTQEEQSRRLNAACLSTGASVLGRWACADGDGAIASGYAATAIGVNSLAGMTPKAFTIPAGGTTVTIAGDVRGQFLNGAKCRIAPTTPNTLPVVSGTINSDPVFGGVNTTFSLLAPIDLATTGGVIVESSESALGRGKGAFASGQGIAEGTISVAGGGGKAIGPGACAIGSLGTKAYGDESVAIGENLTAGAIDSTAFGGSNIVLGFCAFSCGGAGSGSGNQSSGNASFTSGRDCRAGNPVRTFAVAAGGTTVTIVGNVTGEFVNGDRIPFVPQTPIDATVIYATINSIPAFAAGNTTFSIAAPLDSYTTGGLTVDAEVGIGSRASGDGCISTGLDSDSHGLICTASGIRSTARGLRSTASGAESLSVGVDCVASGNQSQAFGDTSVASGPRTFASGALSSATAQCGRAIGYNALAQVAGGATLGGGEWAGGTGQGTKQRGDAVMAVEVGTTASADLTDILGSAFLPTRDGFNYLFRISCLIASKVSPAVAGEGGSLIVLAHMAGGALVIDAVAGVIGQSAVVEREIYEGVTTLGAGANTTIGPYSLAAGETPALSCLIENATGADYVTGEAYNAGGSPSWFYWYHAADGANHFMVYLQNSNASSRDFRLRIGAKRQEAQDPGALAVTVVATGTANGLVLTATNPSGAHSVRVVADVEWVELKATG